MAGAAHADETGCASLVGRLYPASVITLPNNGAKIITAEWVTERQDFTAYCKVRGQISPVDPDSTPILFAINLPVHWNGKAVQLGGGGLNGTLVEGTGLLRDNAPPGTAPLANGFVTLGTDGGHPNAQPEIGVFFLNAEAVINNAYGANKKAYDLSLAILRDYYGASPSRFYFIGGSDGGRQAMVAVQRYPQDYDGAVAIVPSLNGTGHYLAKYNAWRATFGGGWYNTAKIALLADDTSRQCDQLDGIKDGVISKYRGCLARYKFESIRCPNGRDTGDACLSDQQIAAAKVWRSPYHWGFPLNNGIMSLEGWAVGGEALPRGLNPWIMLDEPPERDDSGGGSAAQFMRYFVMRDGQFRGNLDLTNPTVRNRLQEYSRLHDPNNPDLSAFQKRGGKLILKENTGDFSVSAESNFTYFGSVVRTMGADTVRSFIRFYVNPGVNHGGSGLRIDGSAIPDTVDLFGELDKWVETGKAPNQLTVVAYKGGRPAASKPLCEFPEYPRYKGNGDPDVAANYNCAKP